MGICYIYCIHPEDGGSVSFRKLSTHILDCTCHTLHVCATDITSILKMQAVWSSENFPLLYQTIRYHNAEISNMDPHRVDNLRPQHPQCCSAREQRFYCSGRCDIAQVGKCTSVKCFALSSCRHRSRELLSKFSCPSIVYLKKDAWKLFVSSLV
jgi:hypothetical protein